MRTEETNYMMMYWYDLYVNLRKNEYKTLQGEQAGVLANHPQISRLLRGTLINWIFHVCEALTKEDLTVPFLSIGLMDRYYRLEVLAQPQGEI